MLEALEQDAGCDSMAMLALSRSVVGAAAGPRVRVAPDQQCPCW